MFFIKIHWPFTFKFHQVQRSHQVWFPTNFIKFTCWIEYCQVLQLQKAEIGALAIRVWHSLLGRRCMALRLQPLAELVATSQRTGLISPDLPSNNMGREGTTWREGTPRVSDVGWSEKEERWKHLSQGTLKGSQGAQGQLRHWGFFSESYRESTEFFLSSAELIYNLFHTKIRVSFQNSFIRKKPNPTIW